MAQSKLQDEVDEVITAGAAADAAVPVVEFDWRSRPSESIWPRSRFGLEPPRRPGQCAFPSCPHVGDNNRRLRFQCKRCKLAVYCSKSCRADSKGIHDLVCDLEALPEEVELFLHDLINKDSYVTFTELALDICMASYAASDLEHHRILPEGRDPVDLVRGDEQSEEEFSREYVFALAERVFRAVGQYRVASFNEKTTDDHVAAPISASSSSAFIGLNLFAAVIVMMTGAQTSVPLAMLATVMHRATLAPPRGFSFFSLEEGHIVPGLSVDSELSFQALYERDTGDRRMSPIYLIYLAPLDPATAKPLTVLLWRVGDVAHLHQAVPGHYTLGEWLRRLKTRVDESGYAAKPMTQRTVVMKYIKDLMLLTNENASAGKRRSAICRVLGLCPSDLKPALLGIQSEENFPLYAVFVCRAFAY